MSGTAGPPPGRVRPSAFSVVCLVAGWAVIVFAIHGMVADPSANPPHLFRLLVELNVLNDAIAVPVIIALAVVARRWLPVWLLLPVQAGLVVSAVVALYAVPLVGGWGKSAAAGPSRLPFDYAHNLAGVLVIVWLICGLWALWRWRRPGAARR